MKQCKSLNKIQKILQFWRQWFVREVIDEYVMDLPSQTMERDVSLSRCSLILLTARITDMEELFCFFNIFFISRSYLLNTRKLLVSIIQKKII